MTDLASLSERLVSERLELGGARKRWLEERRGGVGASDVAAILGEDPRRGPLAVYAEKTGAIESSDNDWMAFGRDVEGAIAKAYHRRTHRPVFERDPYELVRHPDLPWLFATPDRLTEGIVELPAPATGPGPLECKAVSGIKASAWEELPPIEYQIQLQIQMACTGAAWGSLVALIGGLQVVWKDLPRSDRFLAAALPRLEEFHLRVQRRDPPPKVDALESTGEAIKAIYSTDDGATVPLDHAALGMANRWEAARTKVGQAQQEADELENALRLRVGSATFGALPDGSFLTLKLTKRKAYTREVEAGTYRALRRYRPRLRRRA